MSLLSPVEELVNYIISHIHEGLLLNKLDSQQLKANISEGNYILQDIKFNVESINANLPSSPLHISSASAAKMNLNLPSFLRIFDQPIKIRFTDLEINLCSAKSSGFYVNQANPNQLSSSDESPGINLLTKSIGKFLSTISVEICYLTINIISESASLQLTIPKLLYNTKSSSKVFTIEGVWATVNNDLNNKICVVENDIEGRVIIDKAGVEMSCCFEKLMVYLNFAQIRSLCAIAESLGCSTLIQAGSSELFKALKEIDMKIGIDQIVKTTKLNFRIGCLDVIIYQEPRGFDYTWEYDERFHREFGADHIHFRLQELKYDTNPNKMITISNSFIDYYHYSNQDLTNSSMLFESAHDEYFSEFFKIPNNVNSLSDKISCKKILIFEKTAEESAIRITDQELFICPVRISLNKVIADDLLKIYNAIRKSLAKESQGSENEEYLIVCREINVEFAEESSNCWCVQPNVIVCAKVEGIRVQANEKVELSVNQIAVDVVTVEDQQRVVEINRLLCDYSLIKPNDREWVKPKSYHSYFDSNQGFILLSKNNSNQPAGKLKILENEDELINKLPDSAGSVVKVSVTSIMIDVSLENYNRLSAIKFPEFSGNQTYSSSSIESTKYFFSVHTLNLSIHSASLHCENISIQGYTGNIDLSICHFKLSTTNSTSYSTTDSCISLKYSSKGLVIKISDSVFHYPLIQDMLSLLSNFSSEKPPSTSQLPLKISIENSSLIIPINQSFLSVFLTDVTLFSLLGNNSCIKLNIGACCIVLSCFQYDAALNISVTHLLALKSFILLSLSCISIRLVQAFMAPSCECKDNSDCLRSFDEFFICHTPKSTEPYVTISISIGSCVMHLCKDTIPLISTILSDFPLVILKDSTDLSSQSLYYEPAAIPNEFFHFHDFPSNTQSLNTSIFLTSLFINCYSGREFPTDLQPKKDLLNRLMFKTSELSLIYSSDPLKFSSECDLNSLEVINYLSNSNIKKIICRDIQAAEIVHRAFELKVLGEKNGKLYEIDANLQVAPVKINLDQAFVQFCAEWADNENEPEPPEVLQESEPQDLCYVKCIIISPVSLSIDYAQNNTNLISLFKIEDFLVVLPRIELKDHESLYIAAGEAWKVWMQHLEAQKYVALIGGLSPVVSISNITRAIFSAIKTPFDSESPAEGVKRGILGMVKVFSLEGLKVFDSVFAVFLAVANRFKVLKQSKVAFSKNIKQAVNSIQPDKKKNQEDLNKYKKPN